MDILDVYLTTLPVLGLKEEEGLIHNDSPVEVSGKPLALPTKPILRKAIEYTIYHPASENITMGPSLVVSSVRAQAERFYNITLAKIILATIVVTTDTDVQADFGVTELDLLSGFHSGAKPVDVASINNVLNSAFTKGNHKLIHFAIRSKVDINGTHYNRGVIVSSPLYIKLNSALESSGPVKVNGIKLSKRAALVLKAAMDRILPDIDKKDTYSVGGTTMSAPIFQALVTTTMQLASILNTYINVFCKDKSDDHVEPIPLPDDSWMKQEKDLARAIALVETHPGNGGSMKKNASTLASNEPAPRAAIVTPPQQPSTAVVSAPPQQPAPQQAPVYQQAPPQQPAYQQAPPSQQRNDWKQQGQPMYQQAPPMPPSGFMNFQQQNRIQAQPMYQQPAPMGYGVPQPPYVQQVPPGYQQQLPNYGQPVPQWQAPVQQQFVNEQSRPPWIEPSQPQPQPPQPADGLPSYITKPSGWKY